MATTYTTNTNIRLSFPTIDDLLLHTSTNVETPSGSLSELFVLSTAGTPESGTIYLVDDLNTEVSLAYTGKKRASFLFSTALTLTNKIPINTPVFLGDAQLDYWRENGKAWVDSLITNASFPTGEKARLEEAYVFFKAASTNQNESIRKWGTDILDQATKYIADMKKSYPSVIRQNIVKLAEESLTSDEIDELQTGPEGDQ